MSAHSVKVAFESDWHPTYTFQCDAPTESMCHAVFKCECDQWWDAGIRNGVPAHRPNLEDADTWHAGIFDPAECNLAGWFTEPDDPPLSGEVIVPIVATDDGCDGYRFEVEDTRP